MKTFFDKAAFQNHPLRAIEDFIANEDANEKAQNYAQLRFVGYVLDIGYDTVTIITSDPFKVAVGGVPRNSLLIMVPSVRVDGAPPHFTLLRVLETPRRHYLGRHSRPTLSSRRNPCPSWTYSPKANCSGVP